jgi:hypothetical protein
MARLPLPNRAQPLDVNYIYQIANELNALSEEGSALAQGNNFLFSGKDAIPRSSKIYGAQIFAAVKTVATKVATASQTESITFDFQPGFAYPPVVQATIENTGETNTVVDATINIQNVTTTSATAVITIANSGSSSINVHLTAIGLPVS